MLWPCAALHLSNPLDALHELTDGLTSMKGCMLLADSPSEQTATVVQQALELAMLLHERQR